MHDDRLTAGASSWSISKTDRSRTSGDVRDRLLGWLNADTLAVLDALLALGLFGVYLKIALLAPQWGAVARFLGKEPGQPLGFWDGLGFFADDFVLNLIVVPLVGTIVLTAACGAWRAVVAAIVVAALSLAYFIELRASTVVGQYISGEMLHDFIGWSTMHASSAADYLTAASILKLAVLLAVLCALVLLTRVARRTASTGRRRAITQLLAAPAAAVLLATAVLAPLAYATRLPQSPLNTSAVARAAGALFTSEARVGGSPWLSLDDALGSLRHLTGSAPFDRTDALVGAEAGSDLIVLMMETGPAQAFERPSSRRPGAIDRLRPHALVSPQHYTAHPYSSDALFAVLSGTYPHARRALLEGWPDQELNGLFSSLPADVGLRGVYLPSLYQIDLDEHMYATFGARTLYVADRHDEGPYRARARERAEVTLRELHGDRLSPAARDRLRKLLLDDLQALERLKADISAAIASGTRYAVMFFPEIGHGPWPDLPQDDPDVLDHGRALMDLQDRWLGELLDLVEAGGRLKKTVVALTADHGLRTRAEYPALRVGFLSDVMFRVPLLIHAPSAFATPRTLFAPTSHVDLAPTLLALLGAPDAAAHMHGIPVWQRTTGDRLYLLASAYGGADGFLQDGRFYMHQALSGAVYASDRLAFGDGEQVHPGDPIEAFVVDGLERASRGQHALATRLRAP